MTFIKINKKTSLGRFSYLNSSHCKGKVTGIHVSILFELTNCFLNIYKWINKKRNRLYGTLNYLIYLLSVSVSYNVYRISIDLSSMMSDTCTNYFKSNSNQFKYRVLLTYKLQSLFESLVIFSNLIINQIFVKYFYVLVNPLETGVSI